MSLTQTRGHAGHPHSQQHDTTYLISQDKKDAGVRITRIGLFVNLAMAIGKGVGGYIFHSQALVADAFHALTDLVSDFMTLATVSWSLKPSSQRFPYGYGKVESLGALSVSGLLLFGGIGMGVNAAEVLYSQWFLSSLHENHHHGIFSFLGHDHSHGASIPDLNAAWLAAASIIVKEWLYRKTMKIAKARKSAVLASNAVHHRIDSLTSIVALFTIGGAHVFADAVWLDPVGGLIISAMVIKAGWENSATALLELADVSVDRDIQHSVRKAAEKALAEDLSTVHLDSTDRKLIGIDRVEGVKSGQNYLIDMQLVAPEHWTMQKLQTIENLVRCMVGAEVRGVRRVRVRFVPQGEHVRGFQREFIGAEGSRSTRVGLNDNPDGHGHLNHQGRMNVQDAANDEIKRE